MHQGDRDLKCHVNIFTVIGKIFEKYAIKLASELIYR